MQMTSLWHKLRH